MYVCMYLIYSLEYKLYSQSAHSYILLFLSETTSVISPIWNLKNYVRMYVYTYVRMYRHRPWLSNRRGYHCKNEMEYMYIYSISYTYMYL